ncbi:MAG: hypothetical protein U5J97_01775, partial [Trueperaceae bacterium]|nr:hypothetical protein [Trueperaceae bacterium]
PMNGRDPLTQRLDALAKRIEEIGAWRDHELRPVDGVRVRVDGEARPIAAGEPWPTRELPTVFEVEAEAPADWRGQPLELHVDVGGEALVLVDGVARLGSNPFHRRLRLRDADGDRRTRTATSSAGRCGSRRSPTRSSAAAWTPRRSSVWPGRSPTTRCAPSTTICWPCTTRRVRWRDTDGVRWRSA